MRTDTISFLRPFPDRIFVGSLFKLWPSPILTTTCSCAVVYIFNILRHGLRRIGRGTITGSAPEFLGASDSLAGIIKDWDCVAATFPLVLLVTFKMKDDSEVDPQGGLRPFFLSTSSPISSTGRKGNTAEEQSPP